MAIDAELRRMLDHAKKQYALSITPKDWAFWRNRIQYLEAELKELQDQFSRLKGKKEEIAS